MTRAAVAMAIAGVGLAGCLAGPDAQSAGSAGQVRATTSAPSVPAETDRPGHDCDAPCYAAVESAGSLHADVVVEPSGMAASERNLGVYYVVSDEAGTSEVAAVQAGGTLVARIEIEGMDARNAEALAVGTCGTGQSATCLYIGDIGDHVGRDDVVVYRVPEPDLTTPPAGSVAADALRFTYPDSPTDAEALLVDDAGRPLIVSKASFDRDTGETGTTRLYRGPAAGGTLEFLGEIALPEPEAGVLASLAGNVVTGASAAGGRVLLRTYDEVLEYRADRSGADLAGFPGWPVRRVPSPAQVQSETVAYRLDGCGYLTASELTGTIDVVTCRDHTPMP